MNEAFFLNPSIFLFLSTERERDSSIFQQLDIHVPNSFGNYYFTSWLVRNE